MVTAIFHELNVILAQFKVEYIGGEGGKEGIRIP